MYVVNVYFHFSCHTALHRFLESNKCNQPIITLRDKGRKKKKGLGLVYQVEVGKSRKIFEDKKRKLTQILSIDHILVSSQ